MYGAIPIYIVAYHVGVIYAEFIILDGQSAAGSAAGLVMGVGIILGGQMAGDTGTWPNSNWSPSKLAKVAAWEKAQLEDARKKPNRRTFRLFDKRTHRLGPNPSKVSTHTHRQTDRQKTGRPGFVSVVVGPSPTGNFLFLF